jgi:hypothetical protein
MDMEDSLDIPVLNQAGESADRRGFDLSLILPQLRWDEFESQHTKNFLLLFAGDESAISAKTSFTQ